MTQTPIQGEGGSLDGSERLAVMAEKELLAVSSANDTAPPHGESRNNRVTKRNAPPDELLRRVSKKAGREDPEKKYYGIVECAG